MSRSEILAKALKLRELSVRGDFGEKDNAARFLKEHMQKHNITDQELFEAGEEDTESFKIYSKYFTDEKCFEQFLQEFFGSGALLGYRLFKIFLKANNQFKPVKFNKR